MARDFRLQFRLLRINDRVTIAIEPKGNSVTCIVVGTALRRVIENVTTMIDPTLRLRRAIHAHDTLLVSRILKFHPSLLHNPDTTPSTTHSPSGLSNTSLHLAASLGLLPICELLLQLEHEGPQHAPQISLNDNHETPLHLAAMEGHAEIAHLLCERCPTSILRRDIRGRDALMMAAIGGHDTVVQIILTFAPGVLGSGEIGGSILDGVDHDGNSALHFASMYGHLLVLRTLLAAGADWEKRNGWSWKAVSYSATVQAEVYFKNLVAEVVKRTAKQDAQKRKSSGTVKRVSSGDGEDL